MATSTPAPSGVPPGGGAPAAATATAAAATMPPAEDVGRLCQLAASAALGPPLALSASNGLTSAGDTARAPANLGKLVVFHITKRRGQAGPLLVLQFIKCAFNLHRRMFQPAHAQAKLAPWVPAPSAVTSATSALYTKDFSDMAAGRFSSATDSVALYLLPGEEVEWALKSQLEPGDVELRVMELLPVRDFYKQFTDCLTLTNEYEGALELFAHHHTAEYEGFLEARQAALEAERALSVGQRAMQTTAMGALRAELLGLQRSAALARSREEAQQRSAAKQRQDAALAGQLTELRAAAAEDQRRACSARRVELEQAATAERNSEEARACAAHDAALHEMRDAYAAELAEVTAAAAAVAAETAAAQLKMESLAPAHEARVNAMEAEKAAATQARIEESKTEIARDVQAYYNRRAGEAANIEAEVRAVEQETRLFDTFRLVAGAASDQPAPAVAGDCGAQ